MDGDEPPACSVHGRDGLGDTPNRLIWRREPTKPDKGLINGSNFHTALNKFIHTEISAVERYCELSRAESIDQFDLLCTGPLTNLGYALSIMTKAQMVSFWRRCRQVVVMGGSFGSIGNIADRSGLI
jgi:inosine-uridine nucleoside N-ribohydrolase